MAVASVSRVLAGRPGVSEAIRQQVLAAVRALDYRPDLAARRLRSRQTDTIGLIVSDIRNPFFTEVSRAVEDVAYQHHLRVILCNADEDVEKEGLYLDLMRDENVSGVILSPTLATLAGFRASDYPFPIVLVDRCDRDTAADAVVLDNIDACLLYTSPLSRSTMYWQAFSPAWTLLLVIIASTPSAPASTAITGMFASLARITAGMMPSGWTGLMTMTSTLAAAGVNSGPGMLRSVVSPLTVSTSLELIRVRPSR